MTYNYQLLITIVCMKKVLISWIATKNDFEDQKINFQGPTFNFHQNFFNNYIKHIILSTEKPSPNSKISRFINALNSTFPKNVIELKYIALESEDVIDFNKIHSHVIPILLEYKDYSIDVFVSPGTPTMQVVWYLASLEIKNIRLLQTISKEHTKEKKTKLNEIVLSQSKIADFLFIKESQLFTEYHSEDYEITKSIEPIYKLAKEIALAPKSTVLIKGETGTGKEHLATFIVDNSVRSKKPFKAINCGAFTPELLESRLFGYTKGAFTSAFTDTEGYLQSVNGGTIFLDEIGDITPNMQVSLLRFLQEGEIQKLGSNKIERADVRVIVATNKNLYEECENGKFRWDLYYRLNVAEIELPPLRMRGQEDLFNLFEYFNQKYFNEFKGKRKKLKLGKEIKSKLSKHSWPGNIRELQNLVERYYAYGLEEIKVENLPKEIKNNSNKRPIRLDDVIKLHINKIVDECNGNLTKAKDLLGIGSVNTIKKYL